MNTKQIYITVAVIGCLLMISGWASAGFSFQTLFSDKSVYTQVSKTETLNPDDTIEIRTDVEKISIGLSEDEFTHITYSDCEKKKHLYSYDGSLLSLSIDNADRKWYDYISFNFSLTENVISVLIPQSFKGKVYVREATGSVNMANVAGLDEIDLSLTTGDVSVSACEVNNARLTTTTGRLSVSGLGANALHVESTTGGISLEGITATTLTSRFATGSISISNASCGTIDARGTTGGIKIDNVIAIEITLRSTTGGIKGNIAGRADEFSIDSSTATGNNNLTNIERPDMRKLSVGSTTGNINITFAE